jgi:hypothetical protein
VRKELIHGMGANDLFAISIRHEKGEKLIIASNQDLLKGILIFFATTFFS